MAGVSITDLISGNDMVLGLKSSQLSYILRWAKCECRKFQLGMNRNCQNYL